MKEGLAPVVIRSRDSVADLQRRERAERAGGCEEQTFFGLVAKRWAMGRLEITFPDGYTEPDLSKLDFEGLKQAIHEFPSLIDALRWAGWTIPACD
ncbi:hypothetical protein [Sphingomonas sp. GB1N7]|uniref:hypothetical protein n=1 Tax=Parasphingomonas caseinilytica TaxID=3096158 RepID=UPI002FCACC69